MSPRPQILHAEYAWAVLRATFVAAGIAVLLALILAPATTIVLGGLALAFALGQAVATLRRGSDNAVTGNGLLLEHE